MEKQEIYTPMEQLLIEALITKEKLNSLLALDIKLLQMEEQQDMMDGIKGEEYLL